jgi:hypothetical protein
LPADWDQQRQIWPDDEKRMIFGQTRGKFWEVHQATGSPIAQDVLRRIAVFHAIGAEIRDGSAASRQAVREHRARPLVDDLKPWLDRQLQRLPRRSGLADAIRYALARWPALCRFLDDGQATSTSIRSSVSSARSRLGARTISSPAPTVAPTGGPPSAP